MRGILSAAGYVPYRRLARSDIKDFMGSGGGKGTRAVASHDEDTTTLGVEAARLALRSAPGHSPETVWFATSVPAYLDKTNATAVAAALRLPGDVGAYDFGGALRSGVGCLIAALRGGGTNLVVVGDLRDGLPTSADESAGGDAGAAVLVGEGPGVLAELVAVASASDEFTDRWRTPGDRTSKLWEERFGENRYLALGQDALARALKTAGLESGDIGRLVVTGMHGRAVSGLVKKLGLGESVVVDDLTSSVGQSGTAHPLLVLAGALESMAAAGTPAGTTLVALHLADGADAVVLRTTDALAGWHPVRPVADQIANGAALPYSKFLAWRGQLQPEPPRRPEPARVSSTAAYRNEEWKFGFVGSKDRSSGAVHLPPSRDLHGGRRRGRHGAGRHGRRHRHRRHVDDRPVGLLAEPAHRVRRRRLRRGRPLPGRADRRRPRRDTRREPGRNDLPPAVQRRRHTRLLLEGAPCPKRSGGAGGEA